MTYGKIYQYFKPVAMRMQNSGGGLNHSLHALAIINLDNQTAAPDA
jgi:hypothetical protein